MICTSTVGSLMSFLHDMRFLCTQDEVQERARTAALKAAQKALGSETPTYNFRPPPVYSARDEFEQNGSTSSAAEGDNGLPSLPYKDLPPLDAPPSQQGTPDL